MKKYFLLLLLTLILNTSYSGKVVNNDFSIILMSETTIGSARLLSEPIKNRWGVVEIQSTSIIDKEIYINLSRSIISVDCLNSGIEIIRRMFNTKPKDSENWMISPIDRYRDGFNPEKIKHQSVEDALKKENQEIFSDTDEETKNQFKSFKPFFPEIEQSAVNFACSIIKNNLSEEEASANSISGFLTPGLKSLICIFPLNENRPPIELIVRFNESRNMLQAQNIWQKSRYISPDSIFSEYNSLQFHINRVSGLAKISKGDFSIAGTCEQIDNKRKF